METFLLVAVIVLVLLAVMDLIVGVGNDAVNFLNSSIGSKVAGFRTIMWVATIGIFIGALSSAGMMEIAREGIFNPEYFTLQEVIIIFLAVMVTDILLLDAFNTIGMPTSTTVSIIFELLGAAIVISMIKILDNDQPMSFLFNINDSASGITGYLNWSKTNTIVFSIFLSVLIAFTVGALVMWISRLLFSFNYHRKLKYTGVIWASLAMLAMSYFLVYKGLKSTYSKEKMHAKELVNYIKAIDPKASDVLPIGDIIYLTDVEGKKLEFQKVKKTDSSQLDEYEIFFGNKKIKDIVDYLKSNMVWFLTIIFVFWLLVFIVLLKWNINPFRIVVFAGTFCLAMAFAGNDLVNFIGVPLAGWQSYDLFQTANAASGGVLSPLDYKMIGLKFPIQTPYVYLLFCGLIMVLTLWFSKKARSVTETEVKLGTQEETEERFNSNMLSRMIVHTSLTISKKLETVIPITIKNKITNQFVPITNITETEAPAFDLVRASVNLTIASMLIALGTSLKLPLSTTYVTFMVAMGTSLADRAWGRESAAYRIAGVINVIGGWFITALIAFVSAGLVAAILINFKLFGLIGLLILMASFITYTSYRHRQSEAKKERSKSALQTIDLTTDKALQKTAGKISESLIRIADAYKITIEGLIDEDLKKIEQSKTINADLVIFYSDIKNNLFKAIKKSKLTQKQTAQLYILSNDMMQDILQSLTFIIEATDNHVKNAHKPLDAIQTETILLIENEVLAYLKYISISLNTQEYDELGEIKFHKRSIFDKIELALSSQVDGISKKEYGFKNTDIILSLLLETKDLVAISVRFSKLLHRLNKGQSPLGTR